MRLTMTLNGRPTAREIHPGASLMEVLRDAGCWSVKNGCQDGNCGTCVVTLDGEAVNSCLVLAAQAQGAEVVTTEGLGNPRAPHPIQRHFVDSAGVQCGYCTPGLIMSTKALLDRVSEPTDDEIKAALDGNLCRCTGYVKIMDAVRAVAAELAEVSA